jgi:hypothetical protein
MKQTIGFLITTVLLAFSVNGQAAQSLLQCRGDYSYGALNIDLDQLRILKLNQTVSFAAAANLQSKFTDLQCTRKDNFDPSYTRLECVNANGQASDLLLYVPTRNAQYQLTIITDACEGSGAGTCGASSKAFEECHFANPQQ